VFDAGAIEARLTVNLSQFNRDMAAAEARVKRFEDTRHEVKVSAVFDNASMSKATKAFSDLDQQISRQAMQRLRSSPQGSVLGALNALFSPHPVTGAPTASQASQQGLLGKIISAPGGGGSVGSGGSVQQVVQSAAPSGATSSTQRVSILPRDEQGRFISTSGVAADAEKAGRDAADAAERGASDEAKKNGSGWFKGMLTGVGALFASAIGSAVGSSDAKSKSKGKDDGGLSGLVGNTSSAIGANLFGMSTKMTAITGAIASALAALPALGGLAGAGIGTALIGGLIAKVVAGNAGLKAEFSSIGKQASAMLQQAGKPIIPAMQAILRQIPGLIKQIEPQLAGVFKVVAPQLQSVFTGLVPVIKGLLSVIQAAAPAVGPFIRAIESLVSGILPGLATITKAVVPVMGQFGSIMAQLGGSLGKLFSDMAPAVRAGMTVLGALFSVISTILPIVAKLADVLAAALTPIIVQLSGVIRALTPVLTIVAKLFASFAGAVLGDVVAMFGALATVLKGIGPALATFATAISGIFTALENNGVFATLGNAIEMLAGPLTTLINALLNGLSPILPVIIGFIGQLSGMLATGLANAVTTLIPPLTQLATNILQGIAEVLPVVLPLLLQFAGVFTGATVAAMGGVATALAKVVSVIPPVALGGIVTGILAVVGAMKLWALGASAVAAVTKGLIALQTVWAAITDFDTIALKAMYAWDVVIAVATKAWAVAQAILDAAMDASVFGLIVIAIAALVVGIVELVKHWSTVWGAIRSTAEDAWHWLDSNVFQPMVNWFTESLPHAFGLVLDWLKSNWPLLLPLILGPFGAVIGPIIEWHNQIIAAFVDTWHAIYDGFIAPLISWFTVSLPHAFDTAYTHVVGWGTDVKNALMAAWNWVRDNVGTPINTFFTVTLPGWFTTSISFLNSHFVTPFQNGLRAAYDWVVKNVADPIETLFTKTIPGWFGTAVSAISGLWNKVEGVVLAPVKFVVDSVLDPLINLFDDVTNAVGLGKPIPTIKLARGGKLPGYGGGDILPALLEPGEAVIDKDKTRQYAWLFKLLGVPGFATGGVAGGPPLLGARGGGNPKAGPNAPGTFGSTLHNVIGAGVDMGKAILAIATGNPTALANAIDAMFGGQGGSGGMGGVIGQALLGMPAKLVGDFAHWIIGTNNTATSQAGGGTPLHPTGSGATAQALMQSMAASVGWTGAEWTALNNVEMREAGYNTSATNPSSGAYGLAQFINGPSEYAAYGGNSTTVAGQITGMLNYIKTRYGDPEAAWAHEMNYGWYDRGGYLQPGYTLAYNGTGRPEQVMANSQGVDNGDLLDAIERLIAVTAAVPASTGRHVGGAINNAAYDASFRRRYPAGGA